MSQVHTFELFAGDLDPPLQFTIESAVTQAPVDLTGATAAFTMTDLDGNVLINSAAATVDDPTLGSIVYAWQAGDTDTAGNHDGQLVVTYSGGNPGTFLFKVKIHARLA